jgi:hypothetical protein
MGISRRMGVAISGLAFAGAAMTMLGTGQSANAQTPTVTPQHSATSSSLVDRRRWWNGTNSYTYTYDYYWYDYGCGCGCC